MNVDDRRGASAYEPSDWTVLHGDALWWLRELPESSIDAVVTDPPYGIGFMGHAWDRPTLTARVGRRYQLEPEHWSRSGRSKPRSTSAFANAAGEAGRYDFSIDGLWAFAAWCEAWATAVLRVLKPGGHLLVFGAPRTHAWLTVGITEAGFEIRDEIAWLFGSGFPKSRDLGDGRGTALKPAHEPIVLARKPSPVSIAATVAEHGTGALHIDASRIPSTPEDRDASDRAMSGGAMKMHDRGRWPANVALDQAAAALLDEQSGQLVSDRGTDVGGASRFYYCAKASAAERNAGLEALPATAAKRTTTPTSTIHNGRSGGRRVDDRAYVPTPRANGHPTVKPIDLMRWLIRLVTPAGGVVLDPFTGSGTTGCAAVLEGFDFVGIEREAEYVALAEARIAWWEQHPDGLDLVAGLDADRTRRRIAETGQLGLLGGVT